MEVSRRRKQRSRHLLDRQTQAEDDVELLRYESLMKGIQLVRTRDVAAIDDYCEGPSRWWVILRLIQV